MRPDRIPVLVLGLGNVLCGDDGLGVIALHRLLAAHRMPDGVIAVDGGTLGLSLLPLLERAERAILIDAVLADAPPGAEVRISGDEVGPAARQRLSPHQIGVADLLDGASLLGRYPSEVVIVGLVPASIELALGCTAAVAARIPALVDRVVAELVRLGHPPTSIDAGDAPRWSRDATRALEL
jgi:hydrogenase maturation protease